MAIDLAAEDPKPFRRLRAVGFWLFLRYNELRSWLGFVVMGPVVRRRRFRLAERDYGYFVARYNDTWANERAVELPIILNYLRSAGGDVLEVGRVLDHYIDRPHDVVDRYEMAPGVINEDVLDFGPDKRYALIVTISTLEHVGFDEDVRDPDKPARAVRHLRSLLRPDGRLVVTIPLGYNPDLDQRLLSGSLKFDEVRYMKRVSRTNRWREASAAEVAGAKYASPYREANALVVAVARATPMRTPPDSALRRATRRAHRR
jgi:SAM-dependent methyltransferase